LIDLGGESTRPGSSPVDASQQQRRVLPVIEKLRARIERDHPKVAISIDTTRGPVARAALEAGALLINDISAGREDPSMFELASQFGVPMVVMHMQGTPQTMQNKPHYEDVLAEVDSFLRARIAAAVAAGLDRSQVIIDPGIGFGKTAEHNLKLLGGLERFCATGQPVLLGASRKRFMGSICRRPDGTAPEPHELVEATCATSALGVAAGVHVFRVHDVEANRRAADVAWAVARAGGTQGSRIGS